MSGRLFATAPIAARAAGPAMSSGPVVWALNDASPGNAGLRLRVRPFADALAQRGVPTELLSLADLARRLPDIAASCRAVVLAKPQDSAGQLLLRALLARRVPVALDMFDNYLAWSPGGEMRQMHWPWLRNLRDAPLVIAGTPYLEGLLHTLRSGPTLLLPDPLPAPVLDDAQRHSIGAKWSMQGLPQQAPAGQPEQATAWPQHGTLELLWFGISSNPFFHAGLETLVDAIPRLAVLRDRLVTTLAARCELRLTLCTNRGPALDAALAALRRAGLCARFVEWSEPACADLLAQSHVVLLPSSLSGFNAGKSHNRCSDALLRHCLVLANPGGPYQGFVGDAVLDSVDALVETLAATQAGQVDIGRLTQRSLARIAALLQRDGDPATRLLAALDDAAQVVRSTAAGSTGTAPVLLCHRSAGATLKLARSLGWLTLGFAEGRAGAASVFDFTLTLPARDEHESLATLTLGAEAWTATRAVMARCHTLDLIEIPGQMDKHDKDDSDGISAPINGQMGDKMSGQVGAQMSGQADGWQMHFDGSQRSIVLLAGPKAELRRSLALLPMRPAPQTHGRDASCEPWIELAIGWLRRLGFDQFDLAADEGGGWPAFAAQADPALAASEAQLRRLWAQQRGREAAWPGPGPAEANRAPAVMPAASSEAAAR